MALTNEQRAHKRAAAESKTATPRYVVYVFDEGYNVYNGTQARMYAAFVLIEALYVDGALVAAGELAENVAKLPNGGAKT